MLIKNSRPEKLGKKNNNTIFKGNLKGIFKGIFKGKTRLISLKNIPLPLRVLIPGMGFIAAVYFGKPNPQPQAATVKEAARIQVETQVAERQAARLPILTQGTVLPKREIDLIAQVTGTVIAVGDHFENGKFFSAQEALLQIESQDYRAAMLAAASNLAEAKKNLAEEKGRARQAKREWKELGNADANALFLRQPQLEAAEARVAAATAALEQAQTNLDRTQVRAPFAGRIREISVNLGQYVSAGSKIARIYDSDIAEIRLPLNDAQMALIDLDTIDRNTIDRNTIDLNTQDKPSADDTAPLVKLSGQAKGKLQQWQGRITRSEAAIDTHSRTHYLVAEVHDPFLLRSEGAEQNSAADPLLIGLFVEAEIEGKLISDLIRIPREALVKLDQIYIVGADQRVEAHTVKVLAKTPEWAWVQSDIPGSSQIIVSKLSLIKQGSLVVSSNNAALTQKNAAQEQADGNKS